MDNRLVLIVSPHPARLEQALRPFRGAGFAVRAERSLEAALSALDPFAPPSLCVLDACGDADGAALRRAAEALLSRCAFTFIAAATHMDGDAFHDAMEGLGMLPPLPADP
ncbi:MAG: hypothetical protein IKS68_05335, partial [Mailhella sp.]|nr:hypothetical protein [Mailhella sp.]